MTQAEIFGNTTGLSPSALRTLERIYRRRVPGDAITNRELATALCEASRETGRQVGALVHRSGDVDYVIVGDAGRLMLPNVGRLRAAEGRFRGLRLIHTHLRNEALSRDDLVDLVRLRLDLVCAVLVHDGGVGALHYAYNKPQRFEDDATYEEVGPVRLERLDVNFAELISSVETDFAKLSRSRPIVAKDGRAMLVYVGEKTPTNDRNQRKPLPDGVHMNTRLRELRELARTAGVEVADVVVQIRERVDPKYVLGKGKLEDVILRAMQLDVQTLIFDCELSPSQASAIASVTDLKIIDRTQLILDIFAQRAESRDGRLQVELAQLKYALPRLNQKDDALSRLTGGIGGRGPGETKLEIGRRRAKERLHHLEEQVKLLAKQRTERRRSRKKSSVPVVAIVGYTNAGKSTLMNTLTGANVLAEDKLFATLDTRSRKLFLPPQSPEGRGREIVLVDTVGLVRDLPQDLFAAFRATFEEAADADLLINLVDSSDPARESHIETTEAVLEELELKGRPRLLVFNKTDLLPQGDTERLALGKPWVVTVSALDKLSLPKLLARISEMLDEASKPPPGDVIDPTEPLIVDGYFVTA